MPGHRFFTPFQKTDQKVILKDEDEFQHLLKVLRLKQGDQIELINGQGLVGYGSIEKIEKTFAVVSLNETSSVARPSGIKVTLACAIPKKAKFETIIEKCTELGVDRIVPLITERTEFLVDGERAEKKSLRFERVTINAAKQCKRLWFPQIEAPVAFAQAVKQLSAETVESALFIPWLEGERALLREALLQRPRAKELIFFIGPEGDFTDQEVRLALRAGAIAVSLGENVLKVDTAAMAVVSFARMNSR